MTIATLRRLKLGTTWSGVLITLAGIVVSVIEGGSWVGSGVAVFGVIVTCVGNFASAALEHRQEIELAGDKARIEELGYRVEYAEERLDDPDLQRIVREESLRYADEHHDDGR